MEKKNSLLDKPPIPEDHAIFYGQEPSQFGHLYLPEKKTLPHPVIVALHGGYWRCQYGLEYMSFYGDALRALGYGVWSLEYRRLGEKGAEYPFIFQDVINGINHLEKIASLYHLDLSRVVFTGHSAGGQLALLAGCDKWHEGEVFGAKRRVHPRGVFSLAGVCDLHKAYALSLSDGVTAMLMGGGPKAHPQRYLKASPQQQSYDRVRCALAHCRSDKDVPFAMSEDFAGYLKSLSHKDYRFLSFDNMGHFGFLDPQSAGFTQVADTIKWLLEG